MKVEVAVLVSPSLIVLMMSVDVKQHKKKKRGKLAARSGKQGRPIVSEKDMS